MKGKEFHHYTMLVVQCPIEGCTYNTPDLDGTIVAALLTTHATTHTAASSSGGTLKVERVKRPTITSAGTTSDWQYFRTRCYEYVTATRVTGTDRILQLLECCDETLRRDLTRSTAGLPNKAKQEVLRAIKSLAIRDENVMVSRVVLNEMRKYREERQYVRYAPDFTDKPVFVNIRSNAPIASLVWTILNQYSKMLSSVEA